MINTSTLLSSLRKQVHILAEEAERFKWEINPQSIEEEVVRATLEEYKAKALTNLVRNHKIDEAAKTALLKTLSKIEKKISLIHKTIDYIASGSEDIDPRIQKMLTKINPETLITPQKIRQYFSGIEQFIELNQTRIESAESLQLAQFAHKELESKKQELLTAAPDYDVCNVPLSHLIENCGLDVTEEIARKGRELTLIRFFEKMLDPRWITFSQPHSPNCVGDLIGDAYLQACISFQSGDTQDYSPLRFIDQSPDESDDEDDLPVDAWNAKLARYQREDLVSLPLKMQCGDVLELFLLLDGSRKKCDLKGLGVLITLGDCSQLAMIINGLKSIVIFNPQGDRERHGCPYLVSFGNVEQAAKFLHSKIIGVKENAELELSDGQLFTLAYRSELQAVVDENQAKLNELETSQAPLEVSSAIVEADQPIQQSEEVVINEPALSAWDVQKQAIDALQKAIEALSSPHDENYVQALGGLTTFNGTKNLMEPISAHLLQLQSSDLRNEISQKGDMISWGVNAFQSDATSSDQKLRAVQRVQMNFLLFSLEQCLKSSDSAAHVSEIMKLMEGLKLNPADLPEGQKNLAHCLFGTTYHTYLAAWEKKRNIIHPHDPLFKRDFGRNVYLGDEKAKTAVPNQYKLEAIENVKNLLKKTWGF